VTTRQEEMLSRAVHLVDEFGATDACKGVFPRGPGQWQTVRSLVRLGYLTPAGTGRDIDREVDDDVWVFAPTDAGRAALKGAKT
jgi:hypothetical protein